MKIVHATGAHIVDAQLLLHEYYEAIGVIDRDTPEAIHGYLSASASGLWIAYDEAEPLGCVVLRPLPLINRAAECKRLYVQPARRGRGVADLLLDSIETYALANGLEWIYLDSKDDLREALRIYRRRGYEECERYNDNPQATIFLRKNLKIPSKLSPIPY